MVQLAHALILAAAAATIALATPAPAGFVPFQDPDMDDPAVIFNAVQDGHSFINLTATALMTSRADQDDGNRADNARAGLGDLQDEQALLSQMLNALANAGDVSVRRTVLDVLAVDRRTVAFY
ncbi:hypothetical protein F4781DRAFT_32418 [Annulohypoxylon bovei var. microspora]|nr:hypothetical protein F4781DRAFT_32418 [Annulohypoxylon bovei var. microspora]